MEFDGKFSQRACNAWLKAHQQMALSTYYINKLNLSRQSRDEQLARLTNLWKERNPTKFQLRMTALMTKYNTIMNGFTNQAELYRINAENILTILKTPVQSPDQKDESLLPETTGDQN